MMVINILKSIIRAVIGQRGQKPEEPVKIYVESGTVESAARVLLSVWDNLKLKENTQAFHLASVFGFEEWVDMVEARRRIKDLFGIEYKNERSLYPYLKTLVDLGLMETINIGGRRQWRKRDLIIKAPVEEKKEEKEKANAQAAAAKEKKKNQDD